MQITKQGPGCCERRIIQSPFLPGFLNKNGQLQAVRKGELQRELFYQQIVSGYQLIPPRFYLPVLRGLLAVPCSMR